MPTTVFYHNDFLNGNWRCNKFSDFSKLTPQETIHLANFVLDVEFGEPVSGKNKESWLRDDGSEIPERIGYKTNKLWHYHAGPFSTHTAPLVTNSVRERNISGYTSGAVVHYKWLDPSTKKEMLVIAFSPQHIPFPFPRSNPNPLDARGGILINKNNKITKAN